MSLRRSLTRFSERLFSATSYLELAQQMGFLSTDPGKGTELVVHKPSLASSAAIVKSMRTLLDDEPSLGHFFTYVNSADAADATDAIGQANADNWADVTHALRSLNFREKRLKLPAGILPMAKMDFTTLGTDNLTAPADRTVLDIQGTVQLIGTDDSQRCIFGTTQFEDAPPGSGDPVFIRGVTVQGGSLLIAPRAGENYMHGMLLDTFVEAEFNRVYVSGDFAPTSGVGSDGHRKAVKADVAFLNRFSLCIFASPGAAPVGKKSYNFWQGSNNNNNNLLTQCRLVGARLPGFPDRPDDGRIGLHITGENNILESCDLSVLDTLVESEASRSLLMQGCYGEIIGAVLDATIGLTQAPKIIGGFYEVAHGKTAIKAGSSQGLEVSGGRWNKVTGATGTTFIDLGSACYGRTIHEIETIVGREFDTWETGVEWGHGDLPSKAAEAIKTSRLMFPETPVPSNDPNTLDAYAEGTWTPVYRDATLLGWGGTGSPVATYIKIGKLVTLFLRFSLGGEALASVREISGLPFAPDLSAIHGVAIGEQVNPGNFTWRLHESAGTGFLTPINSADGTDRTPNQLSNTKFSMVITYQAAA